MTATESPRVGALREKAAEVHGTNVVAYSTLTCIAYAFLGARDWGWWWAAIIPAAWFVIIVVTMIPAALMIKAVALRRHNIGLHVSGIVMMLRPIWIGALTWFGLELLARLVSHIG
jgi:hypothetical protein